MTLAERFQKQITPGKAIMIGVVFAGLYYAIGYNNGSEMKLSISQMQSKIQESEAESRSLEKQIERMGTLQKVMQVLGGEFGSFLSYIPEKFSLPELMRIISTEARAAGVSVNGIGELGGGLVSHKPPSNSGQFYEELGVDVELQGTYAQILLFLSYLTKIDKILTVSQLSMVSQAKVGDRESPIIVFKCQIKGYRYLQHGPATSSGPNKG